MTELGNDFGMGDVPHKPLIPCAHHDKCRTSADLALQQEMQSGLSEEDISELARNELSYAEPGERVFVDTSGK